MSVVVKVASIPFLSSARDADGMHTVFRDRGNLLAATEDELARMSAETLARLRHCVQEANGVPAPQLDPQPEIAKPAADAAIDFVAKQPATDPRGLAVEQIVASAMERSGVSSPLVLMFAGAEPSHEIDEVTARVASALCDQSQSRVLLIDSDEVSRNLTEAARQTNQRGITEVIERNCDWRRNVMRNEKTNLDFMPSGKCQFGRWNQQTLLRKAVGQMKGDYQFVCVASGDAHSRAAKLWSDVCDGSYLLVSVKNSNSTIAKSAVTQLKSGGARLLGCVVTDVEQS